MNTSHKRIFGLDVVRSIAILLVLWIHSAHLIEPTIKYNKRFIPDGVDLFFVLSGFLIGNIILNQMKNNNRFNLHDLKTFLKRRWLRTLPNYYLFLVLNVLLVYFGLIKGFLTKHLITFPFFLQNFHKPYDFLFWESWSLSIEEWFYILLPLLIFSIYHFYKKKTLPQSIYLFSVIILLIAPIFIRLYLFNVTNDYDLFIKKLVITRLDTIAYGLIIAYFYIFHKEKLEKSKFILFLVGIILFLFCQIIIENNEFFLRTFYLSFLSISLAITLPIFIFWEKGGKLTTIFKWISILSYSVYLLNLPLLQLIENNFYRIGKTEIFILYLSLTFCFAYFIYRFFEKPIMNLRERK